MSDTYTQPKVDFIHNQIPNKLESIRSLLEGEYASAAQSPDHETGHGARRSRPTLRPSPMR